MDTLAAMTSSPSASSREASLVSSQLAPVLGLTAVLPVTRDQQLSRSHCAAARSLRTASGISSVVMPPKPRMNPWRDGLPR